MTPKKTMYLILSEFSDIIEDLKFLLEADPGLALTALSMMTEELQQLITKASEALSATHVDSKGIPSL